MNDLIQTFNELSEPHRRQLLAYADTLLIQQKARKSDGNLVEWKEKIKTVSTWSQQDIDEIEEASNSINKLKIPEW